MPDFTPSLPDCDSTGPSGGSWAGTFARFPACGSPGACHEAARDAGDVLALIPAHLELERRRHAQLAPCAGHAARTVRRSEEHTSELQSRNDISYAVFCLKKKKETNGVRGRDQAVLTKP